MEDDSAEPVAPTPGVVEQHHTGLLGAQGSDASDHQERQEESGINHTGSESSAPEESSMVGVFDKQINEAMHAIEHLREELCSKAAELEKAKAEPQLELRRREEAWAHERQQIQALYMQQVELHAQQVELHAQQAEAWNRREREFLIEKEELLRLLEYERSKASDVIALLHGTIRELQWTLIRKFPEETSEDVESLRKCSPKANMVKVHASHMKDIDQYICELKAKLDDLEKGKAATGEGDLHDALLHLQNRLYSTVTDTASVRLNPQPGAPADRPWNWRNQRCVLQDMSVPSRQHQRKWVVDGFWVEHVRKEHTSLLQQLALERQRVAALGAVEAEKRLMEAMMLRAIEEKNEFQLKLSQFQQQKAPAPEQFSEGQGEPSS